MADNPSKTIYWKDPSDYKNHFNAYDYLDYYKTVVPDSWTEKGMLDFHSVFTTG